MPISCLDKELSSKSVLWSCKGSNAHHPWWFLTITRKQNISWTHVAHRHFFFAHRHFLLVLGTIIFYLKILSEQTQTIEMQAVISLLHFLQNYKSLQNAHYISQPCSFKYLMLLVKCTCGSRCFIWQVRCLHPTSQCLDLLLCLWLLTPASHRCGPLAAVVTPQVSDLLSLL